MPQGQALVTGATGFIGRHLVRHLLSEGCAVRVFCRQAAKPRELFGNEVEVALGDLRDDASVAEAVRGVETVYHLGGLYSFGPRAARAAEDVNVAGTGHVFKACQKEKTRRIVHVSSAGVLRSSRPMMTEKDFPDRPGWGERYKRSKWISEKLALDFAARGLPVVIASPTCPIGAGDEGPTPTGQIVRDFLRRQFPVVSKTGLNFLSVDDLARGLALAAEAGRPGERYILGGENLWLSEFLELISRQTNIPTPRRTVPWPVVALAGVAGEIAGFFGSRWADRVNVETAVTSRRVQFFDLSKARTELGWVASTPLSAAIEQAVAWFESDQSRPDQSSTSRVGKRDVAPV